MAVSLQALKIGAEKIEQIQSTLTSLDDAIALISAFTQTDANQALLTKLLENIDDVRTIVGSVDLMTTTTEDINKGTYLGNRKIDIDVSLNKTGITSDTTSTDALAIWNTTTDTVYYDQATCLFNDGTSITIPFVNDSAQAIQVSTHGDIKDQLLANTTFTTKLTNTSISEDVGGKVGTLLRIADVTGSSSNLDRVDLQAVQGSFISATPQYYWALTTSALQTLANRVGDIIALGNDIDKIIVLASRIDEMLALQSDLTALDAIYADLTAILDTSNQATIANTKASEASASATSASADALTAKNKAEIATAQAEIATAKSDEIKGITAQATTLTAGSQASAIYNPVDGKFTFGIPQGLKGDRGDAFTVDAYGNLADKSTYDAQPLGYAFLALDTGELYFKLSATSGDWSVAVPFGKGDTGATGATGNGIASSVFLSTTDGSGLAGKSGATDTYRITYTDASTFDFSLHNGIDSAVLSVAGRTGAVVLTSADITDLYTNASFTGSITEQVSSLSLSALDTNNGTVLTHTMTADETFSDGIGEGQALTLILTSGGFTPTWPTITWVEGQEPTYGTRDKFYFEKISSELFGTHVWSIA